MSNTGTRAAKDATYLQRAQLHSVVDTTTGCWSWNGYMSNGQPYVGQPRRNGVAQSPVNLRRQIMAEVNRPPTSDDVFTVVPVCGNSHCVNPDHLTWETKAAYRRRQRTISPSARVTLEELSRAWERKQQGESATAIAKDLNISRQGLYRQWERWGFGK